MMTVEHLLEENKRISKETLVPNADRVDQERAFPRPNLQELGAAGLLGLLVPQEFGGAGGGIPEMAQALEHMAQACPSTAMVVLMHYVGTAVVAAKGNRRLREEILPAAARGQHISTLAFSEVGSGTHFYMPVSQVSRNGRTSTLSARKSFVTSAGEADSYVVSTRNAAAQNPTDIDLYLVPRNAQGLSVEGRFEGMGLAGNASAPVRFERVPLKEENRLGAEKTGFQTILEVVLPHFQIGVAAISLGIARGAFERATEHVKSRKYDHAGGAALAAIPRVQFLEAEMALELRSARAYLTETIHRLATGDSEAMLDLLGIKARAAEASLAVVSRAMTLGGGAAFGRRGGLERMFRDAQAASVMAPTTDVLKEFIGKACLGLPLF
jgi:alkylation response protein AidB-like acyl-CoA dehydrogenase